jgi:PAS domain S-box-containing protein
MEKYELENRIKELELELSLLKSGKVSSPLLENQSSFYKAGADLSKQNKVENELIEGEEKFKLFFEKSKAPILVADDKGNYLEVNKAAAEIFEYSINELIGMNVGDLITTSNPNAAAQYDEYIRKGEEIGEFGFISKKGTPKIVQYQAVRIKPDFNLSILMDVTEQKKTSQYARSLIEASLDPLVTISANGKITDVNEASIKVTGVEREKLIDTDFSNYFTEPQKAQVGYQQVFEKGFVADYPLTIKHKNGNLTDVLYNASVYKDDKGNVLGVFAAARDVT